MQSMSELNYEISTKCNLDNSPDLGYISFSTDFTELKKIIIPSTCTPQIGNWVFHDNLTSFNSAFDNLWSFNGDISGWNTSSVEDMSSMFDGAKNFNKNLSGWDTSSVTSMNSMFLGATIFNEDISGWNTSSVTDMRQMFYGADLIKT